jgi:hypothetical protein
VQSARVRDLLVGLVLLGALVVATRSNLAHTWFLLLASGGAVLALSGTLLRPRLLALVEKESQSLIDAALAAAAKGGGLGSDPCPQCGAAETLVVDTAQAFGESVTAFGLFELRVCRQCGYAQGTVSDPSRIPLGSEHGTTLSASAVIAAEDAQVDGTEHEG